MLYQVSAVSGLTDLIFSPLFFIFMVALVFFLFFMVAVFALACEFGEAYMAC